MKRRGFLGMLFGLTGFLAVPFQAKGLTVVDIPDGLTANDVLEWQNPSNVAKFNKYGQLINGEELLGPWIEEYLPGCSGARYRAEAEVFIEENDRLHVGEQYPGNLSVWGLLTIELHQHIDYNGGHSEIFCIKDMTKANKHYTTRSYATHQCTINSIKSKLKH